jgi:hypothetical protein
MKCIVCDGQGWFSIKDPNDPNSEYRATILCSNCSGEGYFLYEYERVRERLLSECRMEIEV